MSNETPVLLDRDLDEYIIRGFAGTQGDESPGSPDSSTQTAHRALRRALVVPLIVAAAFGAPPVQTGVRRLSSGGRGSRSEVIDFHWTLDDWEFTEERGSPEQIQALNALLALPAREGLSLEDPE